MYVMTIPWTLYRRLQCKMSGWGWCVNDIPVGEIREVLSNKDKVIEGVFGSCPCTFSRAWGLKRVNVRFSYSTAPLETVSGGWVL